MRKIGINRKRLTILLLLLFCLSACGGQDANEMLPITVRSDELLYTSTMGYHTIEIFQQPERLVVNASSEAIFFDGLQFVVPTQEILTQDDIEVVWLTLGGFVEEAPPEQKIFAEITIRENDNIICHKKINFLQKGFEAVEDSLMK